MDTSRTNTCSRRSPARSAIGGSKRWDGQPWLQITARIPCADFCIGVSCVGISNGTAELASAAPVRLAGAAVSQFVQRRPEAARGGVFKCADRGGAHRRIGQARRATTSTGENSTMVPVLVPLARRIDGWQPTHRIGQRWHRSGGPAATHGAVSQSPGHEIVTERSGVRRAADSPRRPSHSQRSPFGAGVPADEAVQVQESSRCPVSCCSIRPVPLDLPDRTCIGVEIR